MTITQRHAPPTPPEGPQTWGALLARWLRVTPGGLKGAVARVHDELGLRRVEVSRLDWTDVDWHARTVLVTGKGGHQRLLPLLDQVRQVLDLYVRDERGTGPGPLLVAVHGGRLSPHRVGTIVTTLATAAGVRRGAYDATAHALRHTAATDMLRHGAHLVDVQAALGHQDLTTTQRYLPMVVDGLAVAMGGRRY
jgi:site-specific recombinase XerD